MNSAPSTLRDFGHATPGNRQSHLNWIRWWHVERGRELSTFSSWHDLNSDLENHDRTKGESSLLLCHSFHFYYVKMSPFFALLFPPLSSLLHPSESSYINLYIHIFFIHSNKHISAYQKPDAVLEMGAIALKLDNGPASGAYILQ